jgi:hypothetical protein
MGFYTKDRPKKQAEVCYEQLVLKLTLTNELPFQ